MTRKYIDNSAYYEAKAKLPPPNGKHCVICGRDLPKYKRKYCSQDCYENWNTFNCKNWQFVRAKALKRDNYTCQVCGLKESEYRCKNNCYESFPVHHIIPIKDGGDEFDLDNCITLCPECHKEKHKGYKRKHLDGNHKLEEYIC